MGVYPFRVGDEIRVSVRASVTTPVTLFARVRYVDGGDDLIEVPITHSTGDRSNEIHRSPDPFKKAGWVEHLTVDTDIVKRGEFYIMVAINKKPHHFPIAAGYVAIPHVPLGTFEHPFSGRGRLEWITLADDVTPATVTRTLAAANSFRKIYGFSWIYNSDGNAASRVLRVAISNLGAGLPTGHGGFLVANPNAGAVTLTATEEGGVFAYNEGAGDGFAVRNDNGVLTYENPTTLPQLFPFTVMGNDAGTMTFIMTDPLAGDRHSIHLLQEEWIAP